MIHRFIYFRLLLLVVFAMGAVNVNGQIEPGNGVEPSSATLYALTNATIMVSPTETIKKGTLLVKGERIIAVGSRVTIPKHALEIDCNGKTIVSAFIELSSSVGVPAAKSSKTGRRPQLNSMKKGAYYWNESIHPEINAQELYQPNHKANDGYVQKGFGFALTHQIDGIVQGRGALVSLDNSAKKNFLNDGDATFYSFKKGVSRQTYPSSQMGSIALLRQTLYDAQWYKDAQEKDRNLSLEAINHQWEMPHFFYTNDKWEILRAEKIAKEFGLSFHYMGSGNEFGIVDELKEMNSTIVLPINFPKAYDVTNPYVARQIPLSDLKEWEMAPYNPSVLKKNGISICLSSTGHKNAEEFWAHLRQAVKYGLSVEDALEALTVTPAQSIKADEFIGSLNTGKIASFMIYDENPFLKKAKLVQSWSHGQQRVWDFETEHDLAGTYNFLVGNRKFPLKIKSKNGKFSGSIETTTSTLTEEGKVKIDTNKIQAKVIVQQTDVTIQFGIHDSIWNGSVNLQGKINERLGVFEGEGMLPTGEWIKWSALKKSKDKSQEKNEEPFEITSDSLAVSWFPNMAYGFDSIPEPETVVIKNATLWTNEEDGILENATLIIKNGKISHCGKGGRVPSGATVIDAKGKHVTSGIIDEHSHIAIWKGVNEGGQSISAEVSIADVVYPDDINIYRQLSGGVTTSQLLHGSANPVGGQSALIKLKWGYTPEEMLIDNAPKFIKFALGENVKQTNWGDHNTVRFPQTRMGVEQVYLDGFARAKEYREAQKQYKAGAIAVKPRVDLELEVLNEIMESERFISCHSYIQSEINMLMHVADSMGFRVNTFTHILEGYKLADKMAKHGAGGSTFADWWAYKYEVNDAIPYNAKMMADQGVVVAINSDDAEMGRRLNQEAAKTVKYGGMTEEEAWKLVTLNPAKLLHLDDRMGSLKEGKDADIVIWSDNPLSIRAKVERTIIDGVTLYDASTQDALQQRNQAERARIISKMLNANAKGDKKPFEKKRKRHFHCNTMGEEGSTGENHH